MPKQRLYYEYINESLVPYWYVLTFDVGAINWDNPVYYFEAIKPFEFVGRDEFDDSQVSMPIFLCDLVFINLLPERVGININAVKRRIEKHGIDPDIIKQFIISVPEINDLLPLLPYERKISFTISSNTHPKTNYFHPIMERNEESEVER